MATAPKDSTVKKADPKKAADKPEAKSEVPMGKEDVKDPGTTVGAKDEGQITTNRTASTRTDGKDERASTEGVNPAEKIEPTPDTVDLSTPTHSTENTLDLFTPGGTQVNNSTPDVNAKDSLIDMRLVKPEADDKGNRPDPFPGAKVSKSGSFTYDPHAKDFSMDDVFYIDRPEDRPVYSAMAVFHDPAEDPPYGIQPAYHRDLTENVLFTFPVEVTGKKLSFTMPFQVPTLFGEKEVALTVFDSEGQPIATSKNFQFEKSE